MERRTIVFGKHDIEFAKFNFLRKAAGPFFLESVTGNLSNLLWGGGGLLIHDQTKFELALTQLHWLGADLVAPGDAHLLLPHISKANTGHISELGLAVRVEDRWGAVVPAAPPRRLS